MQQQGSSNNILLGTYYNKLVTPCTAQMNKKKKQSFHEEDYLSYFPIEFKINRINCFQVFTSSKSNPTLLYSRNASYFCDNCKFAKFQVCTDLEFHYPWYTNAMDVKQVEHIPDCIDLAIHM